MSFKVFSCERLIKQIDSYVLEDTKGDSSYNDNVDRMLYNIMIETDSGDVFDEVATIRGELQTVVELKSLSASRIRRIYQLLRDHLFITDVPEEFDEAHAIVSEFFDQNKDVLVCITPNSKKVSKEKVNIRNNVYYSLYDQKSESLEALPLMFKDPSLTSDSDMVVFAEGDECTSPEKKVF